MFFEDKNKASCCQTYLMKHFKQKSGEFMKCKQTNKTPMVKFLMMRPKGDTDKISKDNQKVFRCGTGMYLCLVKHSRQDITNII